ncbi:hypothetical protein phiIBB-PF7Ap44 [Pseudomonas phage phiIBB-PF7A]|uniref:Uncharacterized protein n=1 Tax=Pseudomonas phage phiIBB-PF7A TaxID=942165 RepID=E9KII4_9CAUD|nr:hypothetical protein phiIBB-PF7Ap44 [Pseudomonas phage phiIBB-PF7A]ADV35709.1 hypothetical protein phiIBB-PF7Ap44 [Pseudomonas phage phiIBB-PF7A]
MSMNTNETLDAVLITREERKALAALLYSGLTGNAVDKLGLRALQEKLSSAFKGYWDTFNPLDKHPTMADHGIAEWVSPDSTQKTRNSIQ